MKKLLNLKLFSRRGFTLLEVIITVIVVGVLASLAVSNYLTVVEYSRSGEALKMLDVVKNAALRCYLFDNSYVNCSSFGDLDIEDPSTLPSAQFTYDFQDVTASTVTVRARRIGDLTTLITIDQDGNLGGTGIYSNIR